MPYTQKGKLFVLCGPSGVGKKSLINYLLEDESLNISLSISFTSREKRPNEIDGKDYFFITKEQFVKEIENDNVIEYAKFFNNYYGTPKDFVLKTLESGKNLLLEIEVIGFKKVLEKFPNLISIFILPPSIHTLKERLEKRNTETQEKIKERLEKAVVEIKESKIFKYRVKNKDLITSSKELKNIIVSEIKSC